MSKSAQKEQATTHSSSHGEDDVGEGGARYIPSDLKTTLQKLHVVNSGDRDQAEQMSDYSVSSRTRSKTKSGGRVRHGATEHCNEDTGCQEDDDNIEHSMAKGDRATLEDLCLGMGISVASALTAETIFEIM